MNAPTADRGDRPIRTLVIIALLSLSLPAAGRAEVIEVQAGGFAVRHAADVPAGPDAVWQAMMYRVEDWWHPDHSWSGDASNLYIDPRIGGCFCERLPDSGGAVEHLRIIYLAPGRMVRLDGALGPLADMAVNGRMSWRIEPREGGGSTLTFTYRIHGMLAGGFESLAPVVDGVIGQQHQRLLTLVSAN